MPVDDPRFSAARRRRTLAKEQGDAERAGRLEYLKPAVIAAICVPVAAWLFAGRSESPALAAIATYLTGYAVAVGVGLGALFLASAILLGGAGPLGLGILRMAAAMGAFQALHLLLGANMVAMLIALAALVGLLMWLFDLDSNEAATVAIIVVVLNLLLAVVPAALGF